VNLKSALREAFRANLAPAVILWIAAVAVLAGYYLVVPIHSVLDALAALKTRWDLLFVMPVQALAAGVMPFFFQRLQRGNHRRTQMSQLPYLIAFWAIEGALVNEFYVLQAYMFGHGIDVRTILSKSAVDMLISNPIFWAPFMVAAYNFKDVGYSLTRWRAELNSSWYRRRVLPVYLASLIVWTPAVMVLYALPLALQFAFEALVQTFFGLVLVVMTGREDEPLPQP
jgi:hypothetical protein